MNTTEQTPFINLSNSRGEEQLHVMKNIAGAGHCPFCADQLALYHKKPTIKETDHWLLTENQWPYTHTETHLILIAKKHAEKLSDLPTVAGQELFELLHWIESEYKPIGGAFAMRFGETDHSAATVKHLHVQFVVPSINTIGLGESVSFFIGKPKDQSKFETVGDFYPVEQRIVDNQYKNLLTKIWREGQETDVVHGEPAKEISGVTLRYDIRNGFPLVTERDLTKSYRGGLREHEAFRNGVHTLEGLRLYKVPDFVWNKWVTEEKCAKFGLQPGDIGPGSYGPAFANFPTADGRTFNQFASLERQMKEFPMLRTMLVTPFIPFYLTVGDKEFPRSATVAPCHGLIFIQTNTRKNSFSLTHVQRSADVPVGLVYNLVQYAAIGMMLQRATGMKFTELVYFIHNAHIYKSQYPYIKELIEQPARKLPTMTISREKANSINEFKAEEFIISDYDHGPKMDIPTPI